MDQEFRPQEVAYRVLDVKGRGNWKRRICKTQKSFDALLTRVRDQGGEFQCRDADQCEFSIE